MSTFDTVAGSPMKCHNVERNFMNEDHCTLSYESTACKPKQSPKPVIILSQSNLDGIRNLIGKPIYAVNGLAISSILNKNTKVNAPCASKNRQYSRWVKKSSDTVCNNTANLGQGTYSIFVDSIAARDRGLNEDVYDLGRQFTRCDTDDEGKTDMGRVLVDGECWWHVHPSEFNVYDLAGVDETSYIVTDGFATFHSIEAFEEVSSRPIGRLGDHVSSESGAAEPLDNDAVHAAYRTLEFNPSNEAVLVCGSPDEVASDPFYGDSGFDVVTPENEGFRERSISELSSQKYTVHTETAIHAQDQLRMKTAWALSQVRLSIN